MIPIARQIISVNHFKPGRFLCEILEHCDELLSALQFEERGRGKVGFSVRRQPAVIFGEGHINAVNEVGVADQFGVTRGVIGLSSES